MKHLMIVLVALGQATAALATEPKLDVTAVPATGSAPRTSGTSAQPQSDDAFQSQAQEEIENEVRGVYGKGPLTGEGKKALDARVGAQPLEVQTQDLSCDKGDGYGTFQKRYLEAVGLGDLGADYANVFRKQPTGMLSSDEYVAACKQAKGDKQHNFSAVVPLTGVQLRALHNEGTWLKGHIANRIQIESANCDNMDTYRRALQQYYDAIGFGGAQRRWAELYNEEKLSPAMPDPGFSNFEQFQADCKARTKGTSTYSRQFSLHFANEAAVRKNLAALKGKYFGVQVDLRGLKCDNPADGAKAAERYYRALGIGTYTGKELGIPGDTHLFSATDAFKRINNGVGIEEPSEFVGANWQKNCQTAFNSNGGQVGLTTDMKRIGEVNAAATRVKAELMAQARPLAQSVASTPTDTHAEVSQVDCGNPDEVEAAILSGIVGEVPGYISASRDILGGAQGNAVRNLMYKQYLQSNGPNAPPGTQEQRIALLKKACQDGKTGTITEGRIKKEASWSILASDREAIQKLAVASIQNSVRQPMDYDPEQGVRCASWRAQRKAHPELLAPGAEVKAEDGSLLKAEDCAEQATLQIPLRNGWQTKSEVDVAREIAGDLKLDPWEETSALMADPKFKAFLPFLKKELANASMPGASDKEKHIFEAPPGSKKYVLLLRVPQKMLPGPNGPELQPTLLSDAENAKAKAYAKMNADNALGLGIDPKRLKSSEDQSFGIWNSIKSNNSRNFWQSMYSPLEGTAIVASKLCDICGGLKDKVVDLADKNAKYAEVTHIKGMNDGLQATATGMGGTLVGMALGTAPATLLAGGTATVLETGGGATVGALEGAEVISSTSANVAMKAMSKGAATLTQHVGLGMMTVADTRRALITRFKAEHDGREPSPEELSTIEQTAFAAGGAGMALAGISGLGRMAWAGRNASRAAVDAGVATFERTAESAAIKTAENGLVTVADANVTKASEAQLAKFTFASGEAWAKTAKILGKINMLTGGVASKEGLIEGTWTGMDFVLQHIGARVATDGPRHITDIEAKEVFDQLMTGFLFSAEGKMLRLEQVMALGPQKAREAIDGAIESMRDPANRARVKEGQYIVVAINDKGSPFHGQMVTGRIAEVSKNGQNVLSVEVRDPETGQVSGTFKPVGGYNIRRNRMSVLATESPTEARSAAEIVMDSARGAAKQKMYEAGVDDSTAVQAGLMNKYFDQMLGVKDVLTYDDNGIRPAPGKDREVADALKKEQKDDPAGSRKLAEADPKGNEFAKLTADEMKAAKPTIDKVIELTGPFKKTINLTPDEQEAVTWAVGKLDKSQRAQLEQMIATGKFGSDNLKDIVTRCRGETKVSEIELQKQEIEDLVGVSLDPANFSEMKCSLEEPQAEDSPST